MNLSHPNKNCGRHGSAVIIVLAVVGIILVISFATASRLSSLHAELRALEKAQIKKLQRQTQKNKEVEKPHEQGARH